MPSGRGSEQDSAPLETGVYRIEDAFRLMVDSVVDYAIFMLDPRGRVATWNRGAERIKLYRAAEIIGQHFSIFYPAESIASGLPERELVIVRSEGRYEDEGWRVRKDGSRFWANVVITALRDAEGQLVGFGKMARDLTERRRTEQELSAAYEQVNSVLDCTSDGVVKIDRDWNLVYGNRVATESLPDFHIGRSYWSCFPGVRGSLLESSLLKAMHDRTEATYEVYYAPYQRWYRGHLYPSGDGLSIFFADVTATKVMEEDLKRARFLKDKHVEALSHMAAGLAHEINNPLAIIHASAGDLMQAARQRESLPRDEVVKACERIVKTSDRAIRILRGLRGFGRDADNDPMQTTSAYEMVEQCLELQGLRFERHEIDLHIELQDGLPYVECREAQICQIVTNLLNNAFDAIVDGADEERWVSLEATRAGPWLHLDVTNSGPEIPEDVKAHLMEPFFTTKEPGQGMGIGLSLSKAIALEHKGSLTLETGTKHTCFRLTLPVAPEPGVPGAG